MSTEPNQVKWRGIRLAAGETALPVSMTMDYIRDTDNDTKVQTEESGDEDKVRIDTGGTERVVIDFNGVDLKNHRLIALAAPTTTGDGIRQTATITEAALEDAVTKKHAQSHAITSASDHTSAATAGKMLKANASGLPADATNTDIEVADAVTKKHAQNADKTLQDADADTKIQVEESADEDKIRMDVKGVEAFVLNDDGILDLAKQSMVSAYRSGAQTIPNDTDTKVQLNAEDIDVQAEFDPTTNYRWTATKAGKYLVTASVRYVFAISNRCVVYIYKNGAAAKIGEDYFAATSYPIAFVSSLISIAIGDYIEVYTRQTSGGNLDIEGARTDTQLSIIKVG